MSNTVVGVIGGTGLYELDGLEAIEKVHVETPFGATTSPITKAVFQGVEMLFISRHGPSHVYLPSEINARANIFALKSLGATWCIAVGAVGSLIEEAAPGHLVVPDQIIDRTKGRASTFFGSGMVAHVPFAEPFCPVLRQKLVQNAESICGKRDSHCHPTGTYLCMEGPAFSTRAESQLYRQWGASIIGMTALPEAKLAREAEISYSTLALVTDYDCWRSESADVDVEEILKTLANNTQLAKDVIRAVVPQLAEVKQPRLVSSALQHAIITAPEAIPMELKEELEPIVGKYL